MFPVETEPFQEVQRDFKQMIAVATPSVLSSFKPWNCIRAVPRGGPNMAA